MVKKIPFLFTGILLIVLLVSMFILTSKTSKEYYELRKISNAVVIQYNGAISYEELPQDSIVLNDTYCICKDVCDLNANTTNQFPKNQETVFLYHIKSGEKKKIIDYPSGYSTIRYIN